MYDAKVIDGVRSAILLLEEGMNDELIERYREIHTAVLAVASRKHHWQLGIPGVAKSLLVSRFVTRIAGLGEQDYFHWLLTKHTIPDELFGPPSLKHMVEEFKFHRVTDFKLPVAKYVFADETYKGNSAILNGLLTVMNERKFFNDGPALDVPLVTLFGASNEMPEGEELNAMFDRFLFRHVVLPIQDVGNWIRMLHLELDPDPPKVINQEQIELIHEIVPTIILTEEIDYAMKELRDLLRTKGVEPTDRRWRECLSVIQTEAFLNGRSSAIVADMKPLAHILWADPKTRKDVEFEVLGLAAPLDREALEILEEVQTLHDDLNRLVRENSDDATRIGNLAVEVHDKVVETKNKKIALEQKFAAMGRVSEILKDATVRLHTLSLDVARKGFQVSEDEI